MICRHRAQVLNPVRSLTTEQHAEIKKLALKNELDWSTSDGNYGDLIKKFRAEVKDHYYRWQRRRCCYCSVELQSHKITYDAEHILDKSEYPEYMFDEGNLAAACKLCNQHKYNKPISTSGSRFLELSRNKDDYSIVHPHLDDWLDHLKFDLVGRIVPNDDSSKGKETIRVCGMASLNAARLADQFAIEETVEAETALRTFHEVTDLARKQELLNLLNEMAQRYEHPGSQAVMEALRQDLQLLEPAQSPPAAIVKFDGDWALDPVAHQPVDVVTQLPISSPNNSSIALLPAPAASVPPINNMDTD